MTDRNFAKFEYNESMKKYIRELRMRDRRVIFNEIRTTRKLNSDTYLPHHGLFAGQFATFQILNEHTRRVETATPSARTR